MSDGTKEAYISFCEISASVKWMCEPVWEWMFRTLSHGQNNSKPLIENMTKIFY